MNGLKHVAHVTRCLPFDLTRKRELSGGAILFRENHARRVFLHSLRAPVLPFDMVDNSSSLGSDGGLSVAEDPFGRGRIQPFSQRGEHHGNPAREGVFRR
jgi:hypothetical protein